MAERVEKHIVPADIPGILKEYFGISTEGVTLREIGPI